MNSRDAMYEEEVRAAMEASRREALGLPPAAEAEVPEDAIEDDEVVKDKKDVKKGKRKREDDGEFQCHMSRWPSERLFWEIAVS